MLGEYDLHPSVLARLHGARHPGHQPKRHFRVECRRIVAVARSDVEYAVCGCGRVVPLRQGPPQVRKRRARIHARKVRPEPVHVADARRQDGLQLALVGRPTTPQCCAAVRRTARRPRLRPPSCPRLPVGLPSRRTALPYLAGTPLRRPAVPPAWSGSTCSTLMPYPTKAVCVKTPGQSSAGGTGHDARPPPVPSGTPWRRARHYTRP